MRLAARITDFHVCPLLSPNPHVGGVIFGPGADNVLIGGLRAALMGDICVCPGPPNAIVMGAPTVYVCGRQIARFGDMTAHGGLIVSGCATVVITSEGGSTLAANAMTSLDNLAMNVAPVLKSWAKRALAFVQDRLSSSIDTDKKKLGVKFKIYDGSIKEFKPIPGASIKLGSVEASFTADSISAGVQIEAAVAQAELKGVLAGDEDLGWTAGVEGKVLAAEGFAGIKDGSVGAKAEFTLWSLKGSTGVNIFGFNVSVFGEAGAKAGLGGSLGKKTELAVGPITLGISFGKATPIPEPVK